MQIGLKNTYFTQNLRMAAGTAFEQLGIEDKDDAITHAMGILETIKDWFSHGAQRKALGHLFDMVQAAKAQRNSHLSFDEKLHYRSKTILAFQELADLALPGCEFVMAVNASHRLVFRVSDSAKADCLLEFPFHVDYFDTEQAATCWNRIKDAYHPDDCGHAMQTLNLLVNENTTCGKVSQFAELTRLARPAYQKKFSIEVVSSFDQADLTCRFADQLLYKELSCPKSQLEDVTVALLHFRGRVQAGREDPGFDHRSARMLVAVGKMERYCFNAETSTQAATIFSAMFAAGVTDADIERHCDDLVRLDARFKGCRFIFSKKNAALSEAQQRLVIRTATKIQAGARRFLTIGTKESAHATATAVKVGTERTVLAYRIPQDDGTKRFVAMPSPVAADAAPAKGSSKRVSHKNKDYIGLTYLNPTKTKTGWIHDPSKPDAAFNTFNATILAVITTEKLDCIIAQHRINEKQFISKNVGATDLRKASMSNAFVFSADVFARLAGQLDKLHAENIVHRDTKPGNMSIFKGHARLFDLATMGEMGQFKDGISVGTRPYLHLFLRGGFYNARGAIKLGVQVDRYCFLSSMISTLFNGYLPINGAYDESQIDQFLSTMPCDATKKLDIKKFMLMPKAHPLPKNLSDYFQA